MRLRIPIGRFSSVNVIVYLILLAILGCTAQVVTAESRFTIQKLLVASGSGWETQGFAPATCEISPCVAGGFVRRGFDPGFYPAAASEQSFTFLRYGATSFFVPPVGQLRTAQTFAPVVNDGDFVTTVNVWATAPASLLLAIGDSVQRCEVSPPVTQCALTIGTPAGILTVAKAPTVGCPGCDGELYGFVAWGARSGGTVKVLPFYE